MSNGDTAANKPAGSGDTGCGCVALGLVGFLGVVLACHRPGDPAPYDKARIAHEVAEANAVQVSAETLTRDYQANEVAAGKKYKGKVLEVTGRITQIRGGSSGLFGSPPLVQLAGVRCEFMDNAQIEHLPTGQFVTICGKGQNWL